MADSTSHQPYQFGDVVDGYRWTITGWEPVAAPERTVGVPRLLEKRYAATQEAQARAQAAIQTLDPEHQAVADEAPVVVPDDPPVVVLDETDDLDPAADAVDEAGLDAEAAPEPEPEPVMDAEPTPEPIAVADTPVRTDVPEPPTAAAPEPVTDDPERTYSLDELLNRRMAPAPTAAIEEPAVEEAVVDEHIADEPLVDLAVADEPLVDLAVAEETVADEAVVDEAVVDETVAGETVADETIVGEAVVGEAVAEETVAEDTVADEAVAEEAVADEAVVDETVADEAVAEETVADEDEVGQTATDHADAEHAEVDPLDDTVIDLTDAAPSAEPFRGADPEPPRLDARPESMRAWYGLGIEPVEEPEPTPVPVAAEDDSDAPFAAALALGARRFAETYQPSEIEIIARTASSAARRPVDSWSALVSEPIDEWTAAPTVVPPAEQLDARALTYNATTLPVQAPAAEGRTSSTFEAPSPEPRPEPEPEPRVVTYTPAPPAGWYPGSA
jgi:hypothetical protein